MPDILAELVAISDHDPPVADRPDDRGARSRARQDHASGWSAGSRCRTISEPPRLLRRPGQDARRATPRARSGRRRPGAWTVRRPVPGGGRLDGDARQGQPLERRCARPAPSMAASISARSAGRRRGSRRTASGRSRCSNIPSSAWRRSGSIEVENFPAFIVIDDKGNDFFKELNLG